MQMQAALSYAKLKWLTLLTNGYFRSSDAVHPDFAFSPEQRGQDRVQPVVQYFIIGCPEPDS